VLPRAGLGLKILGFELHQALNYEPEHSIRARRVGELLQGYFKQWLYLLQACDWLQARFSSPPGIVRNGLSGFEVWAGILNAVSSRHFTYLLWSYAKVKLVKTSFI